VVGGLDRPGKILSSEYDIILVPQAEELMPADWQILITRLAGTAIPPDKQQILGDCNPASPQHWIMLRSLDGILQLWPTYHKDNPRMWDGQDWTTFGREYLQRLSESLTGIERARLLDGKWVQAEGVVYSEFGQENICEDEPDPNQSIELSVDDGYVDPRAILFIQRTGTRVLVFDELYHSRHLAEICIGEVIARCKQNGWPIPQLAVGSPEATELIQRFRRVDIPYRSLPHQVVEGIKVVRRLILDGQGVRALQVHKRCKNFISELTDGYKYPPQGSRRDDEKPLDGNDHACDSFRYWAYMRVR
jgi:phage terminase large subunit